MPSSGKPEVPTFTAISTTTTAQLEESEISTMKNLTLGPSCSSCESTCTCPSSKKRFKESSYPFFWRKTQGNAIQKPRLRRKIGILAPSLLKFVDDKLSSRSSFKSEVSSPFQNPEMGGKQLGAEISLDRISRLSLSSKWTQRRQRKYGPTQMRRLNRLNCQDLRSVLPTIPEDESEQSQGVSSSNDSFKSEYEKSLGYSVNPADASVSSCSQQALIETMNDDITINELASYLDEFVYIPKNMSPMAERMYT